jgi:hypothetical protein
MMTAAVRDLHRWNPGVFETDVRTHCPRLWCNNSFIADLHDDDPSVEKVECHYPLIHESNSGLWHFIHGMHQHLSQTLGVKVQPTELRGDIHLTPAERSATSQVEEMLKIDVPFWIIVAGGKPDFTAKWWEHRRYQEVVDYFSGRILFVQVGEASHHHPKLNNVLDEARASSASPLCGRRWRARTSAMGGLSRASVHPQQRCPAVLHTRWVLEIPSGATA